MRILSTLNRTLSEIPPLWFVLIYLCAIPVFGIAYTIAVPDGFRGANGQFEGPGEARTDSVGSILKGALQRSLDNHPGAEFSIADRKLDLKALRDSLQVDNLTVTDGTTLRFRVRFSADDIHDFEGERQLGWSFSVSVPELPNSAILEPSSVMYYRVPTVDLGDLPPSFATQNQRLFELAFGQANYGFGIEAPAIVLSYTENLQLQRYFDDSRVPSRPFRGTIGQMIHLSAATITIWGASDIEPATRPAKTLVAAEAIVGVVLVALFLNSIAYHASHRVRP